MFNSEGQPETIVKDIEDMVRSYVENVITNFIIISNFVLVFIFIIVPTLTYNLDVHCLSSDLLGNGLLCICEENM